MIQLEGEKEDGGRKSQGRRSFVQSTSYQQVFLFNRESSLLCTYVEFHKNREKFIHAQGYLKLLPTMPALTESGTLLKWGLCIRKNSRMTPETIFSRCWFIAFPEFLFFGMSPCYEG